MVSCETDARYMQRALELARRGLFTTHPNPRVGCVMVHDGRIVGEGWHEKAGSAHAEVRAIESADRDVNGATAYVTLEPCSHTGRTPPCADLLIKSGIKRLVVAMEDPNPLVAGSGIARCRAAGIDVDVGLMDDEAQALNPGFLSVQRRGRPWVRLKVAASLDGRTALANGESQWITGPEARADVQQWRAQASAILTGSATILADDPSLDVRIDTPRQPRRYILDSNARVSGDAKIFAAGGEVTIFSTVAANQPGRVRVAADDNGRCDLDAVMKWMTERGETEIHAECGAILAGSLLQAQLVDELLLYLAPTLLGEGRGLASIGRLTTLTDRFDFDFAEITPIGRDLRLRCLPA